MQQLRACSVGISHCATQSYSSGLRPKAEEAAGKACPAAVQIKPMTTHARKLIDLAAHCGTTDCLPAIMSILLYRNALLTFSLVEHAQQRRLQEQNNHGTA